MTVETNMAPEVLQYFYLLTASQVPCCWCHIAQCKQKAPILVS